MLIRPIGLLEFYRIDVDTPANSPRLGPCSRHVEQLAHEFVQRCAFLTLEKQLGTEFSTATFHGRGRRTESRDLAGFAARMLSDAGQKLKYWCS